jgi:hypothetical protein
MLTETEKHPLKIDLLRGDGLLGAFLKFSFLKKTICVLNMYLKHKKV